MTRDYLTLGPTPAAEDCQQMGPNFEPFKARLEMTAYLDQLRRQFPNWENERIYFKTKTFNAGEYSEVVVWFDDLNEMSCNAAFDVENNIPEHWDEEAKKFLTHHGVL